MSHLSEQPSTKASFDHTTETKTGEPWTNNRVNFDRNLAVVIGIDRYSNSGIQNLSTAVGDANAIANLLEQEYAYKESDQQSKVLRLFDEAATLEGLQDLFYRTLPEQLKPTEGDRLIIYFAGHGLPRSSDDGPEGYLVPHDADPTEQSSFLAMRDISKALNQLECHHLLVILDCCFAGTFRWAGSRKLTPILETIRREHYYHFIRHPAWQIITSSAHDQEALDIARLKEDNRQPVAQQRHSPFALALLEGLQPGDDPKRVKADLFPDGVVTAHELFVYLQTRVKQLSGEQQAPGIYPLRRDYDKGEFIFTPPQFDVETLKPAPELNEENNPYRGLKSFDEKHAKLFFGRQALIEELTQQLAKPDQALTVVLGVSGSGKSSLVKAGLIPYLRQQSSEETERWIIFDPMRPGRLPFQSLAKTLHPDADDEKLNLISQSLQQDPHYLSYTIATWSKEHPTAHLLLVIDQLEELLTSSQDERESQNQTEKENVHEASLEDRSTEQKEWQKFLTVLATAITDHPQTLRLVLTLRSDFEPRFLSSALEPYWKEARFPVRAMTSDELRQAIENPALEQALYFEELNDNNSNTVGNLVSKLVDEVGQMPGALPLLSFTLSELYVRLYKRWQIDQSTDRTLRFADYKALGGVAGALTHRATEEYEALNEKEQATLRRVMLRMVAIEGGGVARRQVPKAELVYSDQEENQRVQTVINRFSAARLIVEGSNIQGEPYIEPAHDALVQGWDKLLDWKREEEEDIILQRRLTPDAQKWEEVKSKERLSAFSTTFELIVNNLDSGFHKVEKTSRQVLAKLAERWQRLKKQQERRDKAARFLWNANPYIDVLNQELNSNHNWFNRIESEFVQQSVLQKRRNISWRWRITIGIILTLAGLTTAALIGQRNALVSQIRASQQASEANFALNQQLNALINSLRAGKTLSNWPWYLSWFKPNDELESQVVKTLQTTVYGIKERNLVESNSDTASSRFFGEASNNGQLVISGEAIGGCGINQPSLKSAIESFQLNPVLKDHILQELGVLNMTGISQILVSPDRNSVVIIYYQDCEGAVTAYLWDFVGNESKSVYSGGLSLVKSASFSSNNLLATGSTQGEVRVFDLPNETNGDREAIEFQGHQGAINSVFFNADGTQIETLGEDGVVRLWNWQNKELNILETQLPEQVKKISFSPDGKQLAAIGEGNTVHLWSYQAKQLDYIAQLPGGISINFNLNGKQLAVIGEDGIIRLYNQRGNLIKELPQLSGKVMNVSFSPDSRQLAVVKQDSQAGESVYLFNLNDQTETFLLKLSDGQSSQNFEESKVIFSSDGQQMAVRSKEGSGRTFWWDLQAGQLGEHEGGDLIFSNDKLLVAYLSGVNSRTYVHSVKGEGTVQELVALDTGWVEERSFSPDGSLLAATDSNGNIQLWDWNSERLLAKFQGHQSQITSVSFSPDNSLLTTVGADGTAKLWQIWELEDLIEQGCKWAHDYLLALDEKNSDRRVCDGID